MPANTYGRQVVVPLTNKSGGGVIAGDVVIIDTSNNDAFTTSTAGAVTVVVGIAQDTIASNASGRVLLSGYAALVNTSASVTRGNYGKTHTVAKQAVDAGASRTTGTFCQFLTGGTTPDAVVFEPDLSGAGLVNPMTTAGDIIYGGASGTPTRLAGGTSSYVLTSNGATSAPSWQAGGGGALAAHPLPLDAYAIDGTYGDDFTAASLSGIWTRRNFTSGAETRQYGPKATYLHVPMTSRASGDGYLQTAPAGDWTFGMAAVLHYWPNRVAWSVCVLDSAGTGVGMVIYDSPFAAMTAGITTYTTYSGVFQQAPNFAGGLSVGDRKVWLYLRKSSTNYYGAFSLDGEVWSTETPAFSSSITVDRVGMIIHPLPGVQTTATVDVDWFNKIA